MFQCHSTRPHSLGRRPADPIAKEQNSCPNSRSIDINQGAVGSERGGGGRGAERVALPGRLLPPSSSCSPSCPPLRLSLALRLGYFSSESGVGRLSPLCTLWARGGWNAFGMNAVALRVVHNDVGVVVAFMDDNVVVLVVAAGIMELSSSHSCRKKSRPLRDEGRRENLPAMASSRLSIFLLSESTAILDQDALVFPPAPRLNRLWRFPMYGALNLRFTPMQTFLAPPSCSLLRPGM